MASCGKCNKDVGCGCNLVTGMCVSCYSKYVADGGTPYSSKITKTRSVRYTAPPKEAPPLTEFESILKSEGMSREEKLKRINDILEQARQKYLA